MSRWKEVGNWVKGNAGNGVKLVGALLAGGPPGAIAAAASMVMSATGETEPDDVLLSLQTNPDAVVRLKELAIQQEANLNNHIMEMEKLKLENEQAEHHEAQETIRSGDKAEDKLVKWTRPGMAWVSLIGTGGLISIGIVDPVLIGITIGPAYAYMGLRQIGKSFGSFTAMKTAISKKVDK